MTEELSIWLHGIAVARISKSGARVRITYTTEAIEKFELGTPLLSLSLPLAPEPYSQGVTKAFLDGLLPEGEPRRIIAREVGVPAEDTFGLIRALGRDCAGALVIQPAHDRAPSRLNARNAERLTQEALAALIRNLRSAPLGIGDRVRISLAGVQEKLLLTRRPDGSWGRPVDGTPSTHILKPEIDAYPKMVENELFCMRLARNLGLDVAAAEMTVVAGRKVLVVERFDRIVSDKGAVKRIHQEDFCQATGAPPSRKYEEDGGPPLRTIAGVLQTVAPSGSVEAFLSAVTLNVVIGNGDAHAKNFSLVHDVPGRMRLAPLYDLVSTLHYGDNRLAMRIDGLSRMDRVTARRIVDEGVRWGLSRRRASEIVDDILGRTPAAIAKTRNEIDGLPDEIPNLMQSRIVSIGKEKRE